jgi:hypothetical protein
LAKYWNLLDDPKSSKLEFNDCDVRDCTHHWHAFFHGQPDDQIHVVFYTDVERRCDCRGQDIRDQVCKCICNGKGCHLEELSRQQAVRKLQSSRLAIIQCSGPSFVIRMISDMRSAEVVVQHEGIDIVVISALKAVDGVSPELNEKRNIQLRYWVLTRYKSFNERFQSPTFV